MVTEKALKERTKDTLIRYIGALREELSLVYEARIKEKGNDERSK